MRPVFTVKKAFLDRTKVIRFMDKKTRIAFLRYGGLVRKIIQRSMRSRKGASSPGSPPHAHGKRQLRNLQFFSYDEKTQALVIGPVLLTVTANQMVTKVHEKGGEITFNRGTKGSVTSHYPARPAVKPAHDANIEKLITFYK